mmetsp:Transcript_18884/g.39744  ORF Transcript_18884/g.39744 Transcript_18884/m.39744 type:complete len:569 (-) Transcript_18884:821-2527(-)
MPAMDDAKSHRSGTRAADAKSNGNGGVVATPRPRIATDSPESSTAIPTPTYFAFWSTNPTYHPLFSHSQLCAAILFLSATGTLPLIQPIVQPFLSTLSLFLLRITFIVTAAVSFLHQTGALRRYAIKFAEEELSKNLNGTLITLSDIQADLWRGKVIAQDLIIHNNDREKWEWDSPCLARVGRIEATLNFASVIQLPKIGRILNHTFFDVYTVLIEDVQVFVEKRKNIFNFHLLDPSLDIPENTLIMEDYKKLLKKRNQEIGGMSDLEASSGVRSKSATSLQKAEERGDSVGVREEGTLIREREEKANKIVEKLVGAVSTIGKAANEGGSRGLQSALMNQKDGLVQNLKQLHRQKSKREVEVKDSKDWKTKKEHGVSVMRELGKVVEKNVTDIKNQVVFLQKPPEKKAGWESKKPDDIRVGSILLREARIFNKDILLAKGGNGDNEVVETASIVSKQNSQSLKGGKGSSSSTSASNRMGWARPIVIFELAITGAELCPPMSARCSATGMPVVGISIDRLVDIILKRIMAEVAKSNTGRLFQTAFGDVFSFVNGSMGNGYSSTQDDKLK